jgi:hypothetical protein
MLLGHTRHATHNNARLDAAAHPFRFGPVTGAHNGIIDNWRELMEEEKPKEAWINDSQAPFALLAKHKRSADALDRLTGYWALSWMKKGRLYLCRTASADLHVAYVKAARLLVWASTDHAIRDTLSKHNLLDRTVTIREVPANLLLEFDPDLFNAATANESTMKLEYKSNKAKRRYVWDTSATDERAVARSTTDSSQLTLPRVVGATATTQVAATGEWERGNGFRRYVSPDAGKAVAGRGAGGRKPTPDRATPAGQFEALWSAVTDLRAASTREAQARAALRVELDDALATIETLRAEIDHLYACLNEAGILDGIAVEPEDDGDTPPPPLPLPPMPTLPPAAQVTSVGVA